MPYMGLNKIAIKQVDVMSGQRPDRVILLDLMIPSVNWQSSPL